MTFDELKVGDWFHDVKGRHYFKDAIFIKLDNNKMIAINWNEEIRDFPTREKLDLNFVASFVCQDNYYKDMHSMYRGAFNFNSYIRNYYTVNNYKEIPDYAIYSYDNIVFYKKINDTTAIVISDPYNTLMGYEYYVPNNEYALPYTVYNEIKFDFPEKPLTN